MASAPSQSVRATADRLRCHGLGCLLAVVGLAALALAFWDPATDRHLQVDGTPLTARTSGADRAWVEVDRNARPVAAMVIDGALAEDPELVEAATSATILAIENGTLEDELRESQARTVAAGDVERRRIERDLHDSAQQRLIALRIHLALATEKIDRSERQTLPQ